jgi:hypothetical protein
MLITLLHGTNTSSAQCIGQNNWLLLGNAEFPQMFFEAIQ